MNASTPSERRLRRLGAWLVLLLCGTFMLGVALLLVVGVVVPRVTGATPYVILTSSMRPSLPPGTIVIARPVEPDTIEVGDVITYQLRSGEPETVTHRVVNVAFTTAGHYQFTTQGDSNPLPDAEPVREIQVRGHVWYAIPWVGRITSVIDNHERQLLGWLLGGGLFGYAALAYAGALRDRVRRAAPAIVAEHHPADGPPSEVLA
jgi:signal peptidase I